MTSTVFVTVMPGLFIMVRENDSFVAMAFVSVKISRWDHVSGSPFARSRACLYVPV